MGRDYTGRFDLSAPGPPPGSPGRFLAFNGGQPHFQAISVTPEAMDRASLHNKVATVLTVSAHSP